MKRSEDSASKPKEHFDHGSRLTMEEYQRKVTRIYHSPPPDSAKDWKRAVRRLELNLTIDHRLGCHFPQERRNALWAIQEQVEKRRVCLFFHYLLRRFFRKQMVKGAQGHANFLVDEYAKVLTLEELQQYFDFRPGERPVLPIDIEQFQG